MITVKEVQCEIKDLLSEATRTTDKKMRFHIKNRVTFLTKALVVLQASTPELIDKQYQFVVKTLADFERAKEISSTMLPKVRKAYLAEITEHYNVRARKAQREVLSFIVGGGIPQEPTQSAE